MWEDEGKDEWYVAGSFCLIFPTPAVRNLRSLFGGHQGMTMLWVGQKEIASCSSLAALAGERQEKSLPFPKRLWRAEVTHPGRQGQGRAGKAILVGKITAHVFSTRPTFLFKFPPCPSYPCNLLSWFITLPAPVPPDADADATKNQRCTSIPTSSSAAHQNSPVKQGTQPLITPMTPHHPQAPLPGGLPWPGSVPPPPAPSPGAGPVPAGGAQPGQGPADLQPAPLAAHHSGDRAGWPAVAAAGKWTS